MASRFQRNGTWYIRYKDVDGKWKNYSCGTEATASEAEAIRTDFASRELNSRHKLPVRKIDASLKDSLLTFQKDILPRSEIGRDKAYNTLRREKVVIDNFIRWIEENGYCSYQKMTSETIRKYFDHLQRKNKSAKTRREERRILNKFFKWAIEQHYCQNNPVDIPNPKREQKKPRFFSEEELQQIFAAANPPYLNIFKFLYLTGLRVGELCNLEWKDYLESQKMILIRVMDGNKTKREETVPLSVDAVKIIEEQKSKLGSENNTEDQKKFVFTNKIGLQLDGNNVYRALERILDNEEKPILDASVHTFRHTCASHLVIKGVSLYIVKEILRHASIKETEIYAHLSKEAISTAIQMLSIRSM